MKKKGNSKPRKICKNYLCVVEGQQEKMYLEHLFKLLGSSSINFNIVIKKPVYLRKIYIEYDSVCVFDYDFNKTEFEKNLSTCIELNRNNKQRNIYHAYSNVCFDLWLILHKEHFNKPVSVSKGYVGEVRKIFNLSKEADIKSRDVIEKILEQITIADVRKAIERAKKICVEKPPNDAIQIDKYEYKYYPDPYFSIHEFIEIVLNQARTE